MRKRFQQPNERAKKTKRRTLNMKSRTAVSAVFVLIAATAFAADAPVAQSDAQKSFTTMKSLAGEWEGPVTVPEMPEMSGGKPTHASLRVTSRGHVLVHEFQEAGTPLDGSKNNNPVTSFYLEANTL